MVNDNSDKGYEEKYTEKSYNYQVIPNIFKRIRNKIFISSMSQKTQINPTMDEKVQYNFKEVRRGNLVKSS